VSKTTPVRWWRNDSTRYQSRPPYKAPPVEAPTWDLVLLPPNDSLGKLIDRVDDERRRWMQSLALPDDILFAGSPLGYGRGR